MHGTENQHALLRLLTVLEISCNPWTYDSSRIDFQNPLGDIAIPTYADTLQIASKLGCSTEIIHMHAASSVIGAPIESVYPLQNNHYAAWNRVLVGRNVQQQSAVIKLMWSATSTPNDLRTFSANHFVPLFPTADANYIESAPSSAGVCRLPPSASEMPVSTQESTPELGNYKVQITKFDVNELINTNSHYLASFRLLNL